MHTVYIAAPKFVEQLVFELGSRVIEVRGRCVLAEGAAEPAAWAQNIWADPQWLPISSINDAARQLKGLQRNWQLHSTAHHRRAALIQAQLPKVSAKPHIFGQPAPCAPLGAWTLWDPDRMLAAACTSSPFVDGEVRFVENKCDPPGRAYLKLWEVFTVLGVQPQPHELCLDMGSSPGGWSWVLANLGARVFSVDKAPLDLRVAAMPQVNHCLGSGFGFDPRHAGAVDWFFSDMICYPDKLLALVGRWLELGQCRNFICTLKFQAETDHATARAFAAVPHSRLLHLSCNKHELTWVLLRPSRIIHA
ncbi:MAG: SAM-dependent methyltransferase [Desulfovibrionaceae bacterium]